MTDEQVIQFLRNVRYSDRNERNAKRILSINRIATTAKVHFCTVYRMIDGTSRLNPKVRRAVQNLSQVRA